MLQVKELSYRIGKSLILNNLALSVKQGQFYALAGENGAGKSTLIKIILDLIRNVESGDVLVSGLSNHLRSSRKDIVYLPEKFNVIKEVTGWQYLRFICGIYQQKVSGEHIKALCHQLMLDYSRLNHTVSDYSKGMQQKLGLLSCFMLDVPFVVLDEPLSGLDPGARFNFKNLLKQERERQRTIFYSTHLLADAEEICDRFGILHNGRIVFDGTPTECIQRYQTVTLEQAYMKCITETESLQV